MAINRWEDEGGSIRPPRMRRRRRPEGEHAERSDPVLLVGVALFVGSLPLALALSGTYKAAVAYMLGGLLAGGVARWIPLRFSLPTESCLLYGLAGSTIAGELAAWFGVGFWWSVAVGVVVGIVAVGMASAVVGVRSIPHE